MSPNDRWKTADEAAAFWTEAEALARELSARFNYWSELGAPDLPLNLSSRPSLPQARGPTEPPLPPRSPNFESLSEGLEGLNTLADLERETGRCRRCALGETATVRNFGRGADRPLVIFVTESPHEPETPEGQLLRAIIEKGLKLHPEEYYIAPQVKCRSEAGGLPGPEEIQACRRILIGQLAAARPRIVLALGLSPAQSLSGQKRPLGLLRPHTQSIPELPGLYLRVTYSLRDMLDQPELKQEAWRKDLRIIVPALKKLAPAGGPFSG